MNRHDRVMLLLGYSFGLLVMACAVITPTPWIPLAVISGLLYASHFVARD